MSAFKDCWKRIERAESHRTSFTAQWNALTEPDRYDFTVIVNGDGTGVVRTVAKMPLNNNLALELGEFFYQLRAALDGAVFIAASLESSPHLPPGIESLQFPICLEGKHFNQRRHWIKPLPDELRAWIEAVQPYQSVGSPYALLSKYLVLLNDCARKDRHRQLHLVGTQISAHEFSVTVDPPSTVTYVHPVPANILEDGSVVLEFRVDCIAETHVNVLGKFLVEISVAEIPQVVGMDLNPLLISLQKATGFVIKVFEKIMDE